jgi:hypothetical protein
MAKADKVDKILTEEDRKHLEDEIDFLRQRIREIEEKLGY